MDEKWCDRCRQMRPADRFYVKQTPKSKIWPYCRECRGKERKEWKAAHPEAVQAANERRRESQRIQAAKRYQADPEHAREIQRRYRERHPGRSYQWLKAHPDERRSYKQNRRARQMKGGGSFTPNEWQMLCEHYGNVCICCGLAKPLTADHILPVSKGGSSFIDNIQPLCGTCNSAKGNQTVDYRPDRGAGIARQPRPIKKQPNAVRWHRAYEASPRGETNKSAKLTAQQVKEIRQRHQNERMTCTQLASIYGVHISTIARIIQRENWTHID